MRPKPHSHADWRNGFLFVGNQLALDLVNTSLVMKGDPVELIPDFPSLLRWFQAAELLSLNAARLLERRWGRSPQASQVADRVRRLRRRLREEVLRWEAGRPIRATTLDQVNKLMAQYPMRSRLKHQEDGAVLQGYFDPRQPEDLLAPIAHAAALLFAATPAERVRKCAHCVAQFYDNSKKGNRRWCSMQICGNRQKVSAYAARHRQRQEERPPS